MEFILELFLAVLTMGSLHPTPPTNYIVYKDTPPKRGTLAFLTYFTLVITPPSMVAVAYQE